MTTQSDYLCFITLPKKVFAELFSKSDLSRSFFLSDKSQFTL